MTPTNNLYKAAKAYVDSKDKSYDLYKLLIELQKAITAYEQGQASSRHQENDQVKTKEECKNEVAKSNNFDSFKRAIRYTFGRELLQSENDFLDKIINESMQLYSNQQTSHLKAENERLQKEVEDLKKIIKQRDFMIKHGLGPEDMKNDISLPHDVY